VLLSLPNAPFLPFFSWVLARDAAQLISMMGNYSFSTKSRYRQSFNCLIKQFCFAFLINLFFLLAKQQVQLPVNLGSIKPGRGAKWGAER
jgi:hypothetical protein